MLLTGTFRRTLDEKSRFALPKTLRSDSGDEASRTLVLAPGVDGCLVLYSQEAFQRIGERLAAGSPTGQPERAFSRLFYSRAQLVELDGQGRVRLPAELQKLAGIEREVIVLGVRDHLELWNPERWDAYVQQMAGNYDELAERAFRPSVGSNGG